ncbi:uncharacterized protein LOC110739815 [Chenopodium quinoa]|uniref:uncharacterized protein LOC110739815 n=1 Tax=Chenopodium quinoa TaxID=63459 RepID=UPI000B79ABB9|nr:uncharacterized protein LOC110739815 [Chenopodium quinoa]
MKNIIKKLGLDYKKIDVCPNDCVLFWKDKIGSDKCPTCDALRWKTSDDGTIIELANGKKVPVKVLRHFPLIPRLKRLFMSSKTSHLMRWHAEREKDGKMRHPADSCAWKEFDERYYDFSKDPRNVRLGLSSDGFNPFGMMSTQYSILPVGVETYDASRCETFTLHAALIYTINDFPAYGNLSGWPIKGKRACPYCNVDTCSMYLKGSKKLCYPRFRRFLEETDALRYNGKAYDGRVELAPPPRSWTGSKLLEQMKDVNVVFGKHPDTKKLNKKNKRKKGVENVPWKKKNSFFRLEYWEHLPIRHNLDVMHVEKNVSESIIGTLFGIEGKSKDTTLSRLDLVHLNIRKNLHPKEVSGKTYLPPTSFTLSKKEKEEMLAVLASVRVPDGYAANIKRRFVDGKLSGLKSHDHHILMQQLLPLALRKCKIKKYLQTLQSYVRNKSCPEASIANGALAVECLGFCARYMQDVETKENRPSRNDEGNGNDVHKGLSIFSLKCRAMSKKRNYKPDYYVIEQAHNYVLANCEEVQVYAREYYNALCEQYNNNYEIIDDMYKRNFSKWFADNVSMHVSSDTCVADDLKYLSCFPSMWVNTMTKVTYNGYRWRVKKIDKGCVTQNFGVVVNADTNAGNVAYFGVLTEILELTYPHGRSVLLFRCDWVDPISGVKKDDEFT